MKITILVFLAIATIFVLSQAFISKGSNKVETHKYTILKEYENFEIRKYESSNFSYTTMSSESYKETSKKGFRTLAGYIFGKNDQDQKIAMTSPVKMDMKDSVTMMFMIPSDMDIKSLPVPNNPNVKFKSEPEKIVAAITFPGWASDDKIQLYKEKLFQLLEDEKIEHEKDFSYLGYNPPFELVNRRNEIIVTLSPHFEVK